MNPRHPSIDIPKTKRTKPLEDNSAQERGEMFFPKTQKFPRIALLVNKISIEVPQRKKPLHGRQQPTSRRTRPTSNKSRPIFTEENLPLQKATFEKILWDNTRAGETFFFKNKIPACRPVLHHLTNLREEYTRKRGNVFLKTPRTPHNKAPRRVHKTEHPKGCTKQGISKDAQNTAPRRMHKTQHLKGCT